MENQETTTLTISEVITWHKLLEDRPERSGTYLVAMDIELINDGSEERDVLDKAEIRTDMQIMLYLKGTDTWLMLLDDVPFNDDEISYWAELPTHPQNS